MDKKEITFVKRIKDNLNEELIQSNKNQDENLIKYNDLKNKLKLNLKDDIDNKIQRMKILHEIKQKELYKYDGFTSFEQFIKTYVIAKSQAYLYLRIYKKVLEGVVSIDKIKEIGFRGIQRHVLKKLPLNSNQEDINKEDIPIRILVKNKEVYKFCKEDTKRLYFIIESLFLNKKDILSDLIIEYEDYKREKKKK